MQQEGTFLGLTHDLSFIAETNIVKFWARERLHTKIQDIIQHAKETSSLPKGVASKLYGIANFLEQGIYGRVRYGGLMAIKLRQNEPSVELTPEILACFEGYWEYVQSKSNWADDISRLGIHDPWQLTAQLNRWAKGQQWPQSLQLLRELRETAQEVNVIHLSCVLSALTERWIFALGLLEEMLQDDCEPDTICFNATISACEKCGQLQAVLQLMQQMDDLQVPKSIVTFSSAISASGATWQLALHFLCAGPRNTVSYSAAISSCEKAGNWSVMLLLLEDMLRETLRPNVVTLSACVACCEKGREWRRALEVLRQMERMQVTANSFTYNSAISACERGSQLSIALDLMEEMEQRDIGKDVVTFGAAIFCCEQSGQWRCAQQLLEDMTRLRIEKNVVTANAAISTFGVARKWQLALYLLKDMQDTLIRASIVSFTAAVSAAAMAGSWMTSLALLWEMMTLQATSNCLALAAVVTACETARRSGEVACLLAEMERTSWLNTRSRAAALAKQGHCTLATRQKNCGLWVFFVVQADFRIMVLEASNVPKEYKSLVVSWKKGAKCVSTSPATVHRGRAEWNEPIKVTTALCRVGQQVHFQAKFCWLQVALEDGSVVGNDKVNLAECCDGQIRERTLQIYKAG
eukprot:s309_g20.t1